MRERTLGRTQLVNIFWEHSEGTYFGNTTRERTLGTQLVSIFWEHNEGTYSGNTLRERTLGTE